MLITIIATLVYLFVIAFLTYTGFKHTKDAQDYMLAGRKIHPVIMALSYGATFISTSAIVGFGGAAGKLGMGLLWLTFLNIFMGIFVAFVFFGKRTRRMGRNLNAHTFPELLGLRYNSKFIQIFAGAVIFLFMPIYASAVLKGGVDFIKSYFDIPFEVSLLFFAVIVALYVSMGGLKGVMYTDAFQASIMFVGMAFLLIFTYGKLGGIVPAHKELTELFNAGVVREQTEKLISQGFNGWTSMPKFDSPIWWSLVSTIIMGVGIGVLAQPQLSVRFMTVKSDRELNRAIVSGGIFILMMTGVAFTVGSLSNVIFFNDTGKISLLAAGANDSIIPQYIKNYLPSWFGTLFLLALLAAAMSTLSSQFHAMGTAIGRDIYETGAGKSENSVFITKIGILFVILISTVLTWLSSKLDVSMAIIATGTSLFFGLCAATFLPAYIAALYVKTLPKAAAVWSMIAGFASGAFWIFFIHKSESSSLQLCKLIFGKPSIVEGTSLAKLSMVDPIFIALPLSIIVIVVLKLALKPDMQKAHIDKCFEGV